LTQLNVLTEQVKHPASLGASTTSYTARLAGLHQGVWEGVDADTYLQQERDAWETSSNA
jgi:hypothetical protein